MEHDVIIWVGFKVLFLPHNLTTLNEASHGLSLKAYTSTSFAQSESSWLAYEQVPYLESWKADINASRSAKKLIQRRSICFFWNTLQVSRESYLHSLWCQIRTGKLESFGNTQPCNRLFSTLGICIVHISTTNRPYMWKDIELTRSKIVLFMMFFISFS